MRLINASTLALETFYGKAVPWYAILSHRWNDTEVSFQNLQDGAGKNMPGYSKIQSCCAQAQLDGWKYAWIDSCCIDKTSSAELSEAINSMYSWYKEAQVCYAYLADVNQGDTLYDDLRKSQWFKRGWTLQELLAPRSVIFFDNSWFDIGTKLSLGEIISEITGIVDFFNFQSACVAQKMSWAANRETTRIEDEAYCLLGLFNVNMPPLYGEGTKAFKRLQLEILKTSDDESIFVWYNSLSDRYPDYIPPSGLLADHPGRFQHSGRIRPLHPEDRYKSFPLLKDNPFSMTNKGLHISLNLFPYGLEDDMFIVALECSSLGEDGKERDVCPAICLKREAVHGVERYSRVFLRNEKLLLLMRHDEIRRRMLETEGNINRYIYIKDLPEYMAHVTLYTEDLYITINTCSLQEHGFVVSGHESDGARACCWDDSKPHEIYLELELPSSREVVARVHFRNNQRSESIVLAIVVGSSAEPSVLISTTSNGESLRDRNAALSQPWFVATPHTAADASEIPAPGTKLLEEEDPVASTASKRYVWELIRHMKEARRSLDRISRPLQDGKSISASLRYSGSPFDRQQFKIDVKIDSGNLLRWPAPSWVEELLDSVARNSWEGKESHMTARYNI